MFEVLECRALLTGVTLVTHGLIGDMDWVNSVSDQIAEKIDPSLTDVERLNLVIAGSSIDHATATIKDQPSAIHPGGAVANYVIALDWTDFAGLFTFVGTDEIAPIVASALMDAGMWASFGLAAAPATMPLHLIGHSRGGSLVTALASELGGRGIWVDQLTLLDPRPVPHPYGDPALSITQNVVFADDYWRTNLRPGDFDGSPADGAFNTKLSSRDFSSSGYLTNHADVHLFYAGTVDTEGDATDGIETLGATHRSEWYSAAEDLGKKTGFYFSATDGGVRPLAGIGVGFGGQGVRAGRDYSGAQWPNVDSLRVVGVSRTITLGRNFDVSFRYQDRDSQSDVRLVLDADDNPFNDIEGVNSTTLSSSSFNASGDVVSSSTLTLSTTGLKVGRFFLRAEIRDALGQTREVYAALPIAIALPAELTAVDAANAADGSPLVARVSAAGDIILLQQSTAGIWTRTNVSDQTQIREPILTPLVWIDAKDATLSIAVAQAGDLILLTRGVDGVWTTRDLTAELPASMAITGAITHFTSVDGLECLAGLTGAGELVLFRQTGAKSGTDWVWAFDDLSRDDLAPAGQATPAFVGGALISYTTAWNGLNIAGIDASGDVQSVWWAPGQSRWEAANLSALTGAPKSAGTVTAYLTAWQGINLASVDQSGKLVVTWWVPGRQWAVANMTDLFGGVALAPASITSWVTPWSAMNIAGMDPNGKMVIYWWTPQTNAWAVSPIGDSFASPSRFAGAIAPISNAAATISLFGMDAASGHATRYWWQPSFAGQWQQQDVSLAAGDL